MTAPVIAAGGGALSPDDLLRHATAIADLAAGIAMEHFRRPLDVAFKSDDSPVTQADKAVEAAVRGYLAGHFPDHGIFGEEEGATGTEARDLWVVDPIDGTRSFLSGHPLFGFLLAQLHAQTPRLGLVGMPALGEVFTGIPGSGAWLNGKPIAVSRQTRLSEAILFVNEGDKLFAHHPKLFARLMHCGRTRRFAYDCYPHALLAAGHVDAVIDYDLQPYDFLALAPLVEGAGGLVTDWSGDRLNLQSDGRIISAATPELHRELLDMVAGTTRP